MKVALPNIAGRMRSAERRLARQLAQLEPTPRPAAPEPAAGGELADIRETLARLTAGMRELRDGLALLPSIGALRRLEAERDEARADAARYRQHVKDLQAELDRRRAAPAQAGRDDRNLAATIAARSI